MVTRIAFTGLSLLLAAQRLLELRRSARNEARLRAMGAVEVAPGQMAWMRLLHGTWLVAGVAEVWLAHRPLLWWLALPAAVAFVAGQGLRLAAMRALGARWNVRVLVLPGAPRVTGGVFRLLRHPNYLGVALEIAAFPLIHGAWLTALVCSAANGLFLARRIRGEEAALDAIGARGATPPERTGLAERAP